MSSREEIAVRTDAVRSRPEVRRRQASGLVRGSGGEPSARATRSAVLGSARLVPALFLAGAFLSACEHERPIVKPPTPVRVETVRALAGGGGVRYSANIAPREQVPASFKVAGYLSEVTQRRGVDGRMRALQAGDKVEKGAVLARLRDDEYARTVDEARSSLDSASAAQQKATADKERAAALLATKSLTRADYDAAVAAFDSGRARVEGAQAQLRQAEIAHADCTLRAPIDGTVLDRRIEAGSLVGVGTVGFVVADLSSVKAGFGVPDIVVGALETGKTLAVTTDAVRGAEFEGRITSISPSADPQSRVFDVELTIPNPTGVLKSGMIATVNLHEEKPGTSAVSVVPLSAIVRSGPDPAGYAVFVLADKESEEVAVARRRSVALGEVYGNLIAITSGLATGERVVTSGATMLSDADKVQIIP